MNKEVLAQMTWEIQQTVSNLMNSLRADMNDGVTITHYHSAIMQEMANKVRFIESECKD